jgi:uncharacterized protein (DUF2062 family)
MPHAHVRSRWRWPGWPSGVCCHSSRAPAACINLTDTQSFAAEFASEVRCGSSTVLFLPQLRDPMAHRILETGWEIVRSYPRIPGPRPPGRPFLLSRRRWHCETVITFAEGPCALDARWRYAGVAGNRHHSIEPHIALLRPQRERVPPVNSLADIRRSARRQTRAALARVLLQPTSNECLARSVAFGTVLGAFPVLGTATPLCAAATLAFRLNMPAVELSNHLPSPLQLELLIPFSRLGMVLCQGRAGIPVPIALRNSAVDLASKRGSPALDAIAVWLFTAMPVGIAILRGFVFRSDARRRGAWWNEGGTQIPTR